MKIIELTRNDFESIYHLLTEYLHTCITSDECIKNTIKYIVENKLLLNPHDENKWLGEGYQLIHKFSPHFNAFRSFYLTPNKDKIFYEGAIPIRYLDELKYIDYLGLDNEEIQKLCKKYNLTPNDKLKENETIDEIKKEVAKECAEEHFEVIFEAEISVGDYEQARRLWNEVGDRYIKQFENEG